ncbi:MAG: ABC transporter ATP-binding protein [Lachnospiraceae bacterium]|nr:ABC transporter ATP-binding protein [Lachnospiraceae bacterium]
MKLIAENVRMMFDQKEVLRGASFTFEQGKIYALLGRNGAGKTTFFNCLNEDIKMTGGSFALEDEQGTRRAITPEDVGYVLSTPVVPEFLTARELLKFFLEINEGRIGDPKTPDQYLDAMQIDPEDRSKLLRDFSHGMKNKMQMLLNLISDPLVLLLDEPLTSLDVVAQDEMKTLLKSRKEEHITILSTHIMELALDMCDEVVLLHGGVLIPMDRGQLGTEEYKNRIIAALKDESAQAGAEENDD